MSTIEWLPDALEDLHRLYAFIEPHSANAATRAIDTLIEAVDGLHEFPEKGKPWREEIDFRELLVKFGAKGYVIRYRIIDEKIIIVRVWHALEDR